MYRKFQLSTLGEALWAVLLKDSLTSIVRIRDLICTSSYNDFEVIKEGSLFEISSSLKISDIKQCRLVLKYIFT